MAEDCAKANGNTIYTGISSVDANGEAISKLQPIVSDINAFFDFFIPDCLPKTYHKKTEKPRDWKLNLQQNVNQSKLNAILSITPTYE